MMIWLTIINCVLVYFCVRNRLKKEVVIEPVKKKTVNKVNLSGKRFGRLTVIERVDTHQKPCGKTVAIWSCKCDCGNMTKVPSDSLLNGRTKSCGCLKKQILSDKRFTHGLSKSRIYKLWSNTKKCCYDINNSQYPNIGAKGIKFCDSWKNNFEEFYNWAIAQGYDEELQKRLVFKLRRKDKSKDFCPENCYLEDSRIEYNGKNLTIIEWSKETGVDEKSIRNRFVRGWPFEEIFVNKNFKNQRKKRH